MKFFYASLAVVFLFCSCASNAHIPIPGESVAVKKNISVEYMTIADAYNDLSKYEKAAQYYKLAMKNKKLYWTAYYKLGRCYAMSKNWTEARKVYSVFLKRDPDNLNIKMALAYIYAMEGKMDSSESIYRLLLKDNPSNPDILVNYIDVLLVNEKYNEAETNLDILKKNFSDNKNISSFEKKLEEKNPKKVTIEESEDLVIEEETSDTD